MNNRAKGRRRIIIPAALLLLGCAAAQAAEWHVELPVVATGTLQVERVLPTEQGYVLVGEGADGRDYWAQVVEGEIAALRATRYPELGGLPFAASQLRSIGAGQYLALVDEPDNQCRLAALDATAGVSRIADLPDCYALEMPFPASARIDVDAAGGLWLAQVNSTQAARLQADGVRAQVALPTDASAVVHFAALRAQAAAYALYRGGSSIRVAKLDPARVQWTWNPGLADVRVLQVVTAVGDDAWVIGSKSPQPGVPGPLYLARVSPQGVTRWERLYPETNALLIHAQALPGDRLALAASAAVAPPKSLQVFDAQGGLLWNRSTGNDNFQRFIEAPIEAGNTALPLAYFVGSRPADSSADRITAIEMLGSEGELLRRIPASDAAPALTAQLRDGSLVHVDSDGFNPEQALRLYAADGSNRPVPSLQPLIPEAREVVQSAVSGADAWLVEQSDHCRLRAVSATGAQPWVRELGPDCATLTAFDRLSGQQGVAAIDGNRVCLGPFYSARSEPFGSVRLLASNPRCFGRQDGALQFTLPESSERGRFLAMQLQEDGNLRIASLGYCADCGGDRVVWQEFTAAGRLRSASLSEGLGLFDTRRVGGVIEGANVLARFDREGRLQLMVLTTEGSLELFVFETDGQYARYPVAEAAGEALLRMEPLPQGGWLLHSWGDDQHRLRAIGSLGQLRWSRVVAGGLFAPGDGSRPVLQFASAGNRVLMAQQLIDGINRTRIEVLDASSGRSLWQEARQVPGDSGYPDRGVLALDIDATQRLALVVRGRPGKAVLGLYGLDDGVELAQRALSCDQAADCSVSALRVAAESSLRAFSTAGVQRLDLDASLQTAPLGQPALSGTWYDPATTGQGLQVEYSAATGDLTAAWFSYADQHGFGIDALRWYTLGGRATATDDTARFEIYSNRLGHFDQPLPTESEVVGHAQLQLRSCNELVLSYRFEAGEMAGVAGEMSLQRLTPAVFDCEDAAGGREPAQPAQPAPDSGFSAGQSGAWYEPASAGQGLLFDLRPPSAGGDQAGLLVAGWFTYDPIGRGDDPTAQHWFLLQGDLAVGDHGRARLDVYRTSNGRFDARPTSNSHRVGEAELQFLACDRARLRYRFDDSDLAGSFAGASGEIALEKLLPCAD